MDAPPPIPDRSSTDDEHINLISIFHFVLAGFAIFGIAFLFMHHFMMNTFFSNPEMWEDQEGGPPPEVFTEFFGAFVWFYVFMGVIMILACIANVLSGIFLRQRKYRTFSLVVGGINCLQFPIGSVLGVFTIIVLMRDSVRQSYES